MFRKYVKGGIRFPEDGFLPRFEALRPCLVDGKPATFHRWVDDDRVLLQFNAFMVPDEKERLYQIFLENGMVPPCCSTTTTRATRALVEYPDGSVGKVMPELVTFLEG